MDLKIDQNMVKILQDVTADATDVVISSDGSWKVISDNSGNTVHFPNGMLARQQNKDVGVESNGIPDTLENVVDLTMDEGRNNNNAYEIEDGKPSEDFQAFPVFRSSAEQPLTHLANSSTQKVPSLLGGELCSSICSSTSAPFGSAVLTTALDTQRIGTLESLIPARALNPVITDAISLVPGQEATTSLSVNQPASAFQDAAQSGQVGENSQVQLPRPENSISETEKQQVPRQVGRFPIAIKELPGRTQAYSYQLMHPDQPNSSFNIPSNSPSAFYQTNLSTAASVDGLQTPALHANREGGSSYGWAHPYLMNSGSNITRCTPIVSKQTVPFVIDGDIDTLQISSGPDIVSLLEQHHSTTQNQDQGYHTSVSSYNTPQQPLSSHQILLHQSVNVSRCQNLSQSMNTIQSSCCPSQNAYSMSRGNLVNHHRGILAAQRTAERVTMPSVHPYASISGPSLPMMANGSHVLGFEQLQHSVGGSHLASDGNWRPTGRMRGSLNGDAYSAALSCHLVHPSQVIPPRPLSPSVATSEQLLMSNSNRTSMHGSLAQQANWRNSGTSNQT